MDHKDSNAFHLKWLFLKSFFLKQACTLLSLALFTSYPLLTEGLPLQAVPSPAQTTGLDQCEVRGYEEYEEQCGSETVTLPSCNPGQRRVWRCDPTTGLPDDFDPVNTNVCESCPQGSFQKLYNKCRTCHTCTVCQEGETVVKKCDMETDTKCAKTSAGTVIAMPPTEGSLNPTETASPLNPSSTAMLYTDVVTSETPIAKQSAPPMDSAVGLYTCTCSSTVSFYVLVAFVVVFALVSVFTSVCWYREWLKGRKPQAVNQEIQLQPVINGDVPHHNDENRQPEEREPLLGEGAELDRNQVYRDDDEGNDGLKDGALGPPADGEDHDENEVPDIAHDTSSPLSRTINIVDIPDETGPGATEHPREDSYISHNPPPESASLASGDEEADSKAGIGMDNKPEETLVNGSNGATVTGVAPDDLTKSFGTPNAKTTSASGNCLRDDANSDSAAASCEVDEDSIPKERTLSSNNGDMEGQGSVHTPPNAAPEEGATNAGIDCNGTTDADGANHGAETPGGGQDVESSGDVQDGKRSVACDQPSDHPGVDAGEPNNAPEPAKLKIQADEVVNHQFLQHVAQKISHTKIKEICRMRGLREKDIEDIEALTLKAEQGFEFLKRLLGQVGKELTYHCLLETLIKSKNKHSADELIEEFSIVMR